MFITIETCSTVTHQLLKIKSDSPIYHILVILMEKITLNSIDIILNLAAA
jgi:hypothetical protein